MDRNRQIDVGTLLGTITSMLAQNQAGIDQVDAGRGRGTHGTRMYQAFRDAAEATQSAGTSDAGEQLAIAAQAMRERGQGRAVGFYADGLDQAAAQFKGQSGISMGDMLPLLQGLLGGVQQNNPAQPGQGTMLDALLPAVNSFMGAKQQGLDDTQAAMQALSSALSGAMSTKRSPIMGMGDTGSRPQDGGYIDPGAASATNVLGGIFGALMPGIMDAVSKSAAAPGDRGRMQDRQQQQQQQQQPDADPFGGLGGLIGGLGGLLGGADQSSGYDDRGRKNNSP